MAALKCVMSAWISKKALKKSHPERFFHFWSGSFRADAAALLFFAQAQWSDFFIILQKKFEVTVEKFLS